MTLNSPLLLPHFCFYSLSVIQLFTVISGENTSFMVTGIKLVLCGLLWCCSYFALILPGGIGYFGRGRRRENEQEN